MPDEFDAVLDECDAARAEAALPLKFTEEARLQARNRSEAQFRANVPLIPGGFTKIKSGILRASTLTGALAKAFALCHDPDAVDISPKIMARARTEVEKECKIRVGAKLGKPPEAVGVSDGVPCGS